MARPAKAWLYDGDALRQIPFEDLERQYTPLIAKYARYSIPGYTADDLAQVARIALWRAWKSFDPERERGFEGRKASFTNYLIHAIKYAFLNLQDAADRFYRPPQEMECLGCGRRAVLMRGRRQCRHCGGRRWRTLPGKDAVSIDDLQSWAHPVIEESFENALLWVLPPEMVGVARKLLQGEKVSVRQKTALRRFLEAQV